MSPDDWLCEVLPELFRVAADDLPSVGVGVLRHAGDGRSVLSYIDGFGATGYVVPIDLPSALRQPSAGLAVIGTDALQVNPEGLVETRLLHPSFSESLRRAAAVRELVTVPLPDQTLHATLTVGLKESGTLSTEQRATVETLAARAADALARAESPEAELDRLRRMASADAVLPALFRVLDVREIFTHLSAIVRGALRHDFASIGVLSEDLTEMALYADTTEDSRGPQKWRVPFPPVQAHAFLYRAIPDLSRDLLERDGADLRAGGRTSLRVAIRVDDRMLGMLKVTSREPTPYTATDLAVARHIADYVALALSHHRLSEEARRHEELRARADKMGLLDELLATITSAGELPDVFGRVSAVAQKVLPHDALVLTAVLPNGRQAKVYASRAPEGNPFSEIVDVPPHMVANRAWEYDLIDDLQARPDQRALEATQKGYPSALRVPIRLDSDSVAAGVSFFSFAPSRYRSGDAAIALRIADKIALSFARERREEVSKRADEADARAARLEARVRQLTDELDARTGYRRVVGQSPQWRQVLTQATQVAPTETTVLLLGESGTGKEVAARFVHRASPRERTLCRVPRFRSRCWKRSSSATNVAPSPGRCRASLDSSSRRQAARCSSTKSPR